MSPIKEQLATMIDCLPEAELTLLLEIVKRFVPDDVATPDDIAAIEAARAEHARGESVPFDAINWD